MFIVYCFRYPGLKPPMVGGCDLVGEVVEDRSGSLAPGEGAAKTSDLRSQIHFMFCPFGSNYCCLTLIFEK